MDRCRIRRIEFNSNNKMHLSLSKCSNAYIVLHKENLFYFKGRIFPISFFFLLNWFPPKLIDNGSFISENVVSFAHKIFQCFFLDEKKLLRSLKRVKYRRDCILLRIKLFYISFTLCQLCW